MAKFTNVKAVLFDLDGTFADTAPDMARAINQVRADKNLAKVPLEKLRPHVSMGARGMVGAAFGFTPEDKEFAPLRDQFLVHYARAICIETTLFHGIPQLVSILEQRGIIWGIVTNKATRYTMPLVRALSFDITAACVVCGDTCDRAKPHPDPLLHAANLIQIAPENCLYIGDDLRDIQAANSANMRGVVANYGYLGGSDPSTWNAAASINAPMELIELI
jgi:N-acetyl-D-muramate 6-phosphate phosphatase